MWAPMFYIWLSRVRFCLAVDRFEADAGESDRVPRRKERARVHGEALVAAVERNGRYLWSPRRAERAEEGATAA